MENPDTAVTRESDKFMLRLPAGMRERIAAIAKSGQRSMNAEIVARLAESLDASTGGVTILKESEIDALGEKVAAKVVAALQAKK